MLRTVLISFLLLVPTFGICEPLTLSQRTITSQGVTKNFVIEVDTKDVEAQQKFDPVKDDLPLSIKQAVNLAISEFKKQFNYEPFGVASISLQQFPTWAFQDRYYYSVNLFGKPGESSGANAAVLFSGKVIFSKELQSAP